MLTQYLPIEHELRDAIAAETDVERLRALALEIVRGIEAIKAIGENLGWDVPPMELRWRSSTGRNVSSNLIAFPAALSGA